MRTTDNVCLLRVDSSNNSNNNRRSFHSSKTGGSKPTRTVGKGCGSTGSRVCRFVYLPTLKEALPPPPSIHPPTHIVVCSLTSALLIENDNVLVLPNSCILSDANVTQLGPLRGVLMLTCRFNKGQYVSLRIKYVAMSPCQF